MNTKDFTCPKCGGKTQVLRTITHPNGAIRRRRRRCKVETCALMFWTRERIELHKQRHI